MKVTRRPSVVLHLLALSGLVRVIVCPICAALVHADGDDQHRGSHVPAEDADTAQ